MRYAVFYNADFRHFDEIDEIVFDYSGYADIVDFVSNKFKEQRQKAVINITDADNIDIIISYLNKLKTVHPNFIVQIDLMSQKSYIELLKNNEIDFMFANFANNYDTFYSMIDLGAEDIYITETLCFDLKNLQDARDKYGINLRVIPDVAQYARGTGRIIPQISKFFIRPEDIEKYDEYVDVIEIYRRDDRQSVIYEIYKNQQWLGKLNEIILDLDTDINNIAISTHFGPNRIGCQKRCMIGKCNLCMEIENLANRFDIANIAIIKRKKKYVDSLKEDKKKEIIERIRSNAGTKTD